MVIHIEWIIEIVIAHSLYNHFWYHQSIVQLDVPLFKPKCNDSNSCIYSKTNE